MSNTLNADRHVTEPVWALVELMGHQQIAGQVSEAQFPAGFVRIDVYEDAAEDAEPVFTRVVSPSALYAINPVERAIAIELARRNRVKPVHAYQLSNLLKPASESPPPRYSDDDLDDDPEDDDPDDGFLD